MTKIMRQLDLLEIKLRGWKSIRDASFTLHKSNVLIGANGAGKSNLVAFFRLLAGLTSKHLSQCIEAQGRASSVLFGGPKETNTLAWNLTWDVRADDLETGREVLPSPHEFYYDAILGFSPPDSLYFASEAIRDVTHEHVNGRSISDVSSPGAHWGRSGLRTAADGGHGTARDIVRWMEGCRVYQFHDTSRTSRIRMSGYIHDNQWLKEDGGNLAAVLRRYREARPETYSRAVHTIRQVAPFFDDFDLTPIAPDNNHLLLNWREVDSDTLFGPHQLSDGTLRAMALITLLLQPEDELPSLIVIDEPELGLHPFALNVIAALVKGVSHHSQVIMATQSSALVDQFEPHDVIVVDRKERESTFRRLSELELHDWLEDYSLGQLWEKNVIGGGPH